MDLPEFQTEACQVDGTSEKDAAQKRAVTCDSQHFGDEIKAHVLNVPTSPPSCASTGL